METRRSRRQRVRIAWFGWILARALRALGARWRVRVEGLDTTAAGGLLSDGPRGPARQSKIGVVRLARLTGVPITPVALSARPRLRLRTWDRTLLPMPFVRVVCRFGDPIAAPRDADPEREEWLRRALDRELARLTEAADARLGLGGSAAVANPSLKADDAAPCRRGGA
jgi:1-acyl-sn-glycerol-3-phosphate acyltransferase